MTSIRIVVDMNDVCVLRGAYPATSEAPDWKYVTGNKYKIVEKSFGYAPGVSEPTLTDVKEDLTGHLVITITPKGGWTITDWKLKGYEDGVIEKEIGGTTTELSIWDPRVTIDDLKDENNECKLYITGQNRIDECAYGIILDPCGGTFSELVTEYYASPVEYDNSLSYTFTNVELPGEYYVPWVQPGTTPEPIDIYIIPPSEDLKLKQWIICEPYQTCPLDTITVTDQERGQIQVKDKGYVKDSDGIQRLIMKRNNRDTLIRYVLQAVWEKKYHDKASALLVMPNGVDSRQSSVDLGMIQSITEVYTPSVQQIPIMTYDSSSAFTYDLSVTKSITLEIVRTQPDVYDNTSVDSTDWSSRYWLMMLRTYIDRWQMRSDGCKFYLNIPDANTEHSEDMSECYTEYDGVNCYIASLNVDLSRDTPKSLAMSIPIQLGTKSPKKSPVKSRSILFRGANEESYSVDVPSKLVPFKVPGYLWGDLPRVEEVAVGETTTNRFITFDCWRRSRTESGSIVTRNFSAGVEIEANDMRDGDLFEAVTASTDVSSAYSVLISSGSKLTVDVGTGSGTLTLYVTIVGGGGGGGGAGHLHQYGGGHVPYYTGWAGNGGNSGNAITIPLRFTLSDTATPPITYDIGIGAGGKGGTSERKGDDGGSTWFRDEYNTTYEVSGGTGGYNRYDSAPRGGGYNVGGAAGVPQSEIPLCDGTSPTHPAYDAGLVLGYSGTDTVRGVITEIPITGGEDEPRMRLNKKIYAGLANNVYTHESNIDLYTEVQGGTYSYGTYTDGQGYDIHRVNGTYRRPFVDILYVALTQIPYTVRFGSTGGGGGAPYIPPIWNNTWHYNGETSYTFPHGGNSAVRSNTEASANAGPGTFGGGGGGGSWFGDNASDPLRVGGDGGTGYILIYTDTPAAGTTRTGLTVSVDGHEIQTGDWYNGPSGE